MVLPLTTRLVRVHDRYGYGADSAVWQMNPRTGFLTTRAGLSWTGVREYRTPSGVIRVLRRPEQVNAPAHLKTLRLLPVTDGHPDGDLDVSPANADQLRAGTTGEIIDVEPHEGYLRPVGNLSVDRPDVMAKLVTADAWRDICETYPDLRSVTHDGGAARSGNSLGYNALWYSPNVESEIKGERDDGSYVGEWVGPNGPEEYDVEHIVDKDCEIVQRLVREVGFDAEKLGANHHATALERLGGRGGAQCELMRIVDSREVPLPFDLRRAATRTSVQVPRAAKPARDADWTVSADRDLPIVSGEWDGDKAAASVFDWAGWPDAPDPAKARRAFLLYDADAPDLKGSYKDGIAEVRDGRLVVVDAGLRAAASYLPQTDAPQDVKARARQVLDHYFTRLEETRDAPKRSPNIMHPIKLETGLGRDALSKLAKSGLFTKFADKLPPTEIVTVEVKDELDGKALSAKLEEMKQMAADLIEMVAEAEGKMADMSEEMKDMMTKEEAAAMVAEKEKELAAAKEALGKATDEATKLAADRDSLAREVAPLRAKELDSLRAFAKDFGCDEAAVNDAKDVPTLRRLVAVHGLGERYGATTKSRDAEGNEVEVFVINDDTVAGVYEGLAARASTDPADEPTRREPAPLRDANAALNVIPELTPKKINDGKDPEIDDFTQGLMAAGG